MNIGERIGVIAKESGINLHKLSTMAGIPYNTLYSIVQRKSNKIDPEILEKIAGALGVSQLVLTTGKTEEEWRKQQEAESIEWEKCNRERLFGIFAARHPLFMACLQSMSIDFRIEDGRVFAIYEEEEIVEIKSDDWENLFAEMQKSLAKNINQLWGLPVEYWGQSSDDE